MAQISLRNVEKRYDGTLVLTFTGQFKTDWGGMMAAATLTTLPLMIAFFAVQRSMVRGLTSGAVAGA